jgi:hypothetical protein
VRTGPKLFFLSLALMHIMGYYHLSNSNTISALTEEGTFVNDRLEEDVAHLSYYDSIFSNLSRGLPISGDSSSELSNGQEEDNQEDNSNSTVQEPQ